MTLWNILYAGVLAQGQMRGCSDACLLLARVSHWSIMVTMLDDSVSESSTRSALELPHVLSIKIPLRTTRHTRKKYKTEVMFAQIKDWRCIAMRCSRCAHRFCLICHQYRSNRNFLAVINEY